jgi:hypothetical protein
LSNWVGFLENIIANHKVENNQTNEMPLQHVTLKQVTLEKLWKKLKRRGHN